jgi:hypothetical protein
MFVLRLILILFLLIVLVLGAFGLGCKRFTDLGFSQWGEGDAGPDSGDSTDDSDSDTDTNTDVDAGDQHDSGIRESLLPGSSDRPLTVSK